MARPINQAAREKKRNDILNIVLGLIYSKGYDHFSVQDVRQELGISTGAFHHYFKSREALLDALVERMENEWSSALLPVVDSHEFTPIDKLQTILMIFATSRNEHKSEIAQILEAWYSDRNNAVRQRVNDAKIKLYAPLLASVIREGANAGFMTIDNPDYAGKIVAQLLHGLEETYASLLLASQPADVEQRIETIIEAHSMYLITIERMLCVPPDSLQRLQANEIQPWVVALKRPLED